MFSLPAETKVDLLIPNKILFFRALHKASYRTLYLEQVQELWWRHKLSTQNTFITHTGAFPELEILETKLTGKTLDKRLLRELDRSIPYYILHVLTYQDKYQLLIANKKMQRSSIRVENYIRSAWLDDDALPLDFGETSLDRLYASLGQQILAHTSTGAKQAPVLVEACDAFQRYLQTMAMARSYKPILILATLQYGGQISVTNAAAFFRHYYAQRHKQGLPIEKGRCVYTDPDATEKEIENNLIRNPIHALCGSGFFTYDPVTQLFSFSPGLYDTIPVDGIDGIIQLCQAKIQEYFAR